ncbi:MAG: PCMD domain-containing protein [Chitinophagaceae bacterium]
MKKTLFILILLSIGIILLESCNKLFPFEFDEGNNVESFEIDNFTYGIQLGTPIINPNVEDPLNGVYGSITLVVNKGDQYFPLVFNIKDIKLSAGAVIRNWPNELSLTFLTPTDPPKEFYVVSAHGKVKKWIISIQNRTPSLPDPNKRNTDILSFSFKEGSVLLNGKDEMYSSDVALKDDSVLLVYYTDGTLPINFPIEIKPSLRLPNGAYLENPSDTNAMKFVQLGDVKTIMVIAADSLKKKIWYVALKPIVLPPPPPGTNYSDAAAITDFSIGNYAPAAFLSFGQPVIDTNSYTIYLPEYNSYLFNKPIVMVVANLGLSPQATTGNDYTGIFSFSDFTDTKTIVVIAESGKQKIWKVQLLYSPQLNNSGFEQWSQKDNYSVINGGHWINNNFLPNNMVHSVSIVNDVFDAFEGNKCAEITTQYIIRGAAGVNSTTPVCGGMIFLGAFNFSASEDAIRDPLRTYNFGIPFIYAPTYIHVALKYLPYKPVIKATIKNFNYVFGNAVPNFEITNTGETDKCDVSIKIYDADNNVIGTGNFSTNETISDWKEIYIPIAYKSTASPAKLDIRCSSSQGGLNYIGGSGATGGSSNSIGSKLYLDDIKLWYTPVSTMPKI